MEEKRNAYKVLVGKSPQERPRRRCEYSIKMYLREIEWDDVDWINLAQGRDH
jgi:hypothetical protein